METMKIALELEIASPPERVFDALSKELGAWWPHSFSENPLAITCEPHVGGRFYEDFDGTGNGALFATIVYMKRPEDLRLSGPMGMHGAVVGHIAFLLEPSAIGTLLKLTHDAFGSITDEHREGYAKGWQFLLGDKLVEYLTVR